MPSVGPVLGARVPRTQIAPSSRCGRNSEPMLRLSRHAPDRFAPAPARVVYRQGIVIPTAAAYASVNQPIGGLCHSLAPLGNTTLARCSAEIPGHWVIT